MGAKKSRQLSPPGLKHRPFVSCLQVLLGYVPRYSPPPPIHPTPFPAPMMMPCRCLDLDTFGII